MNRMEKLQERINALEAEKKALMEALTACRAQRKPAEPGDHGQPMLSEADLQAAYPQRPKELK